MVNFLNNYWTMSLKSALAEGNLSVIAKALEDNDKSLTLLDLSGKGIPGKKIRKIMCALDNNTNLKVLNISNNVIEDKYASYIYDTLLRNQTIEK